MRETDIAGIVDRLEREYRTSVDQLRRALKIFLTDGTPPDPGARRSGAYVYPELRLTWPQGGVYPRISRAYARIPAPGRYAVTVTRPELYRDYLVEQLSLLQQDFDIELEVGRSNQEIPFPYVLDPADLAMADVSSVDIARHFPTTELAYIGDEIADGGWIGLEDEPRPLPRIPF